MQTPDKLMHIYSKTIVAAFAAFAISAGIDADACTNLIAAKGATADGSVMVTYAADSHNLYSSP